MPDISHRASILSYSFNLLVFAARNPMLHTPQEWKGGHPDPLDFAQDKGHRRISPRHGTLDLGTDPSPPAQDDTLRHRALIFCLSVIPAVSGRNLSHSVIPALKFPLRQRGGRGIFRHRLAVMPDMHHWVSFPVRHARHVQSGIHLTFSNPPIPPSKTSGTKKSVHF